MRVEIRYYKRFDADLLSLFEQGINLNKYLDRVLYAYAHGQEIHLYVPTCQPHDLNGRQFIHAAVEITDPSSIALLKQVKHGFRNSFCKMLLRDALVYQAFGVYFSDPKYIKKEKQRIAGYDDTQPGVLVCHPSKSRKAHASRILGEGALKRSKAEPPRKEEKPYEEPVAEISEPTEENAQSVADVAPKPAEVKAPQQEESVHEKSLPEQEEQLFDIFKAMMGEGEKQ